MEKIEKIDYSNASEVDALIKKISKEYDVGLWFVVEGDEHCIANGLEEYINKTCSAGHTQNTSTNDGCGADIWLGIYDDAELKLASFFNSLAGTTFEKSELDGLTHYQMVKKIWEIGFKMAEERGITFSDKAKLYADEYIKTFDEPIYHEKLEVNDEIENELICNDCDWSGDESEVKSNNNCCPKCKSEDVCSW